MDATTYRALDTRASQYVATLDETDPLALANALVDRAVALQDDGRIAEAEELLARAEELLG